MIPRASGALLFSYIIVAFAGVLFLVFPSTTLAEVAAYHTTIIVWGLFYIIGGLSAASCILSRRFVKNTLPLWYFEVAGVSLIVSANVVYAYALAQTAMQFNELSILAAAVIVLGFAGGLIARIIETLRLARAIKRYSNGGTIE